MSIPRMRLRRCWGALAGEIIHFAGAGLARTVVFCREAKASVIAEAVNRVVGKGGR